MDKKLITPEAIKAICVKKGYKFFENDTKDLNLNIIGVRSKDMTPNTFNDLMCLLWKYKGVWNVKVYNATTDPGTYYLEKPMNVKGTAIMCPGQYSGVYILGKHTGYPALQQVKPIKVYRDNDKDNVFDLDPKTLESGVNATNIHHAGANSTQVNNWSAGCMVIAKLTDWDEFIGLCTKSVDIYGNSFSYTLLNEEDFLNL